MCQVFPQALWHLTFLTSLHTAYYYFCFVDKETELKGTKAAEPAKGEPRLDAKPASPDSRGCTLFFYASCLLGGPEGTPLEVKEQADVGILLIICSA
jgi:hypothetical protein